MRKQSNLKQNQIGGTNPNEADYQQRNGYASSLRDYVKDNPSITDDCTSSPSAWIYKGGKTLQDLCRPFIGGTAPKAVNKSDASVASWRKMAAKTILSGENPNSDDENDRVYDSRIGQHEDVQHPQYRTDSAKEGSVAATPKSLSYVGNLTLVPDEPRIVAPNVSKLSPRSVVEIRLQSTTECVAILCSVDVLKMRSAFFYEVLNDQEEDRIYSNRDQNDIWRSPLVIPEISPFEAAAFLESLHEGRSVFKGDWVYCWARLSVAWQIQDLILEYAAQIDLHFGNLLSSIKSSNWRTNPNIWVGARVAVFRKGATPMPTVVTGTIVEAAQTTGYSKLRVLFDSSDTRISTQKMSNAGPPTIYTPGMLSLHTPVHSPAGYSNMTNMSFTPRVPSSPRLFNAPTPIPTSSTRGTSPCVPLTAMTGDVGEPLWVQLTHPQGTTQTPHTRAEPLTTCSTPGTPIQNESSTIKTIDKDALTPSYSPWSDPDELCMQEARRSVSAGDKRIFWEMAKAIIELPEISECCNSAIKTSKDLAMLLKKPEFKVLWTAEAADILPKQAASELVTAAYLSTSDIRNINL